MGKVRTGLAVAAGDVDWTLAQVTVSYQILHACSVVLTRIAIAVRVYDVQ